MSEQIIIDADSVTTLPEEDVSPSARQQEVLSAVLDLMVEEGDGFSMASVARRASCSKETLYRWFGDRDGLLTATVQWQASKVVMPELPKEGVTLENFRHALEKFSFNWLKVITGDISIALNRTAISHAASAKSRLGETVLLNGPFAIRRKLEPIFILGRENGLLDFASLDEISMRFFGLVISDIQIRALLGESRKTKNSDIKIISQRAVSQFLWLYQATNFNKEYTIHQANIQE